MNYPVKSHQNVVYRQPPIALAYLCVDNSQFEGQHTSGFIGPRDVSITVRNITHSQTKQAVRPILVGPGAAVGLGAPWGGFAYQEAALTNLTNSVATLARHWRHLRESLVDLDSLTSIIGDNPPALEYLLAQ